jgi:hypothetical protein
MARRTVRVVDKDLGYAAIMAEIARFRKAKVLIGFQETTVTHTQTKGTRIKPAGLSMAQIAAQNEFGTDKIPQRSFMRTSFDENLNRIQALIYREYSKVTAGKTIANKALGIVGTFVADLMRKKIRQITTPPNSPRTIAIKKSSKPLIDFGQMVASITYVVQR